MPRLGHFPQTMFPRVRICKDLQVVGITDLLARFDADEDCHCWSLLSFRHPQCISLRSVNIRSTLRFKARSTPMRECIMKSRPSAAPIRQPMRSVIPRMWTSRSRRRFIDLGLGSYINSRSSNARKQKDQHSFRAGPVSAATLGGFSRTRMSVNSMTAAATCLFAFT